MWNISVKWKENGGKDAQGSEELEASVGSWQNPKLSGLLLIFLIFLFRKICFEIFLFPLNFVLNIFR
jgi:hypothetical protein